MPSETLHPEQSHSYTEVISFLKKMWYHPLLTEATLAHRAAFPERFHDFCLKWEIDEALVVAGPLGSSIWVVSEEERHRSDWDFALFFANSQIYQAWQKLYWVRFRDHRTPDMHNVAGGTLEECLPVGQLFLISPLFLIPDEFLAGNVEMAWQLRLHTLDLYDNGVRSNLPYSPAAIKSEFGHVRYWHETSNPDRFQTHLQRKANEFASRRGNENLARRYQEAFMRSLSGFEPPSDETFLTAIRASRGSLSLA